VADEPFESSKRLLDPVDRAAEVLFGLIMVLAITGSLKIVDGRVDVRTLLIAALGCNLAWGIIDGIFYLIGCLAETARKILIWDTVRNPADLDRARRALAGVLPPVLASALQPEELETMRLRMAALPERTDRTVLHRRDWLAALGVLLVVFLSTFPVVIPFIFMKDARLALRVSNAIAIAMLFLTGYSFGSHIGRNPVRAGIAMVVLGAVLVVITIALGG
jgi:VIT1/CCC1 family predicted Fe2+/Mn2+ transporter